MTELLQLLSKSYKWLHVSSGTDDVDNNVEGDYALTGLEHRCLGRVDIIENGLQQAVELIFFAYNTDVKASIV